MNILRQTFLQYRKLPRQTFSICFYRMIAEMGTAFVFPFLALLLTKKLGFDTVTGSFILAALIVCSIIGYLIGGRLADHFGRKKICLSFSVAVISLALISGLFPDKRIVLIFIALFNTCASIVVPGVQAILVDTSDDSNRNENFSLMYIFINVGYAVGTGLAGFLFYRHLPWIFFSMAILYSAATLIMIFAIQDHYTPGGKSDSADTSPKESRTLSPADSHENPTFSAPHNNESPEEKTLPEGAGYFRLLRHTPMLAAFLLCIIVIYICYIQLSYVLPLQFSDLYGLNLGSKLSSLLWTFNSALCVFITPLLTVYIKKHRPLVSLTLGVLFYAIGFLCYALPLNFPVILISIVIWTTGEVMINTESGVFTAELAPPSHKARAMSLYEFARGTGRCLGPLLTGYLMVIWSYKKIWIAISIIYIFVAAVLFLLRHAERRHYQ